MTKEEFKVIKEKWDVSEKYDDLIQFYSKDNPTNRKNRCNFNCELNNGGWWPYDKCYGKWLFMAKPIGINTTPTLMDSINFITGLLEAEKRNDRNSKVKRPPHYQKTFDLLKAVLGWSMNDYLKKDEIPTKKVDEEGRVK